MSTAANYVAMTLSGTPGTGTATLGTALASPDQSFLAAYGAVSTTVDVEWYSDATTTTRLGCERNVTYNGGSPGTLTRGTPETPGSLVSLPAGASVRVVLPASSINNYERAMSAVVPGGRLTTESNVPVSTSDRTAQTTLYYTPYVHNVAPLWNGTDWVPTTFTEVTQALGTITSGRPYDVFGFLNGSALNTEILAWTNDTTRATAVTLQDGRYCKSGDKTRLLLGTFYTTSTTATEDSAANRYVDNVYNREGRPIYACPGYNDNNAVTSYTSSGVVWTALNAGTGASANYVLALPRFVVVSAYATTESGAAIGIGDDSTTASRVDTAGQLGRELHSASLMLRKAPGQHFFTMLSRTATTFYADNLRSGAAVDPALTYMIGEV